MKSVDEISKILVIGNKSKVYYAEKWFQTISYELGCQLDFWPVPTPTITGLRAMFTKLSIDNRSIVFIRLDDDVVSYRQFSEVNALTEDELEGLKLGHYFKHEPVNFGLELLSLTLSALADLHLSPVLIGFSQSTINPDLASFLSDDLHEVVDEDFMIDALLYSRASEDIDAIFQKKKLRLIEKDFGASPSLAKDLLAAMSLMPRRRDNLADIDDLSD